MVNNLGQTMDMLHILTTLFLFGCGIILPCQCDQVSYNDVLLNVHKIKQKLTSLDSGDEYTTPMILGEGFMRTLKLSMGAEALLRLAATQAVSPVCRQHLNETLLAATKYQEDWAIKMFDADTKLPSGFLMGNLLWIGDYEECVNVTATIYVGQNRTLPTHPFTGQFCTTAIPLGPEPEAGVDVGGNGMPAAALKLGLCVPSTCSEMDINTLINSTLAIIPQAMNTTLQATVTSCQNTNLPYDDKALAAIVFFSILALIIVVGTLYDVVYIRQLFRSHDEEEAEVGESAGLLADASAQESRDIKYRTYETNGDVRKEQAHDNTVVVGTCGKILQAFSVYTNGSKILDTSSRAGNLGCLNGIRFLSMSWVILGHALTFCLYQSRNTLPFITKMLNRFSFLAIMNATVSVDTFFMLSGLLVSYLSMKELKKVGGVRNFRWGMFYFHRFWRLTPAYGLFIFLYASLTRFLYTGPLWPQQGFEPTNCTYWWANLLYVSNLINFDKQCMAWSWYLSNDMQFYLISPLIIIPLYFSGVLGVAVCLVFLVATMLASGLIASINDLPMTFVTPAGNTKIGQYFDDYYVKPYCRIGPYVVGMLLGYILYKTDGKTRMSRVRVLLGWALAAVCCMSVLYGNYDSVRGVHIPSRYESALYTATHSTVWAVGVSWVIYACCTGYGGFVNTLLSWKAFVPLSRLTYTAYLVHPALMMVYYAGKREAIYLTDMEETFFFLGSLLGSFALAFVLSLAIEAPFMGLEKALFNRERRH
ncbi:NRF6-like protein [Mya arenaria]|uniref:NRF6-like protein n=1 Tax=Mya arenaria TaxID=6604 RepID=A0ABY7E418_MYAAR|nr:NRF6-like protein [Mya arenaria]